MKSNAEAKLKKKLRELSRRYPDNKYSIKGPNIVRDHSVGRRPHKRKEAEDGKAVRKRTG